MVKPELEDDGESATLRATRLKLAELTSGVGAVVLGVGLGALVPAWFAGSARILLLVGIAVHAFGMWDKHRIEASTHVRRAWWVAVAYWACWILLATTGLLLVVGR